MKARIEALKGLVNEDSKRIALYTLLCGLFAHGAMLFNKFSWDSELAHSFLLDWRKAVSLGRWMRALERLL